MKKIALNVHLQVVFDRLRFPLPSGVLCTADFVAEFSSIFSTRLVISDTFFFPFFLENATNCHQ